MDAEPLQREVLLLRRRVTRLLALLHLVVVAIKVAEFCFDRVRISDGMRKQRLLRAIKRARTHLPFRRGLKLIGMSSTRYHAWLGKQECGLDGSAMLPQIDSSATDSRRKLGDPVSTNSSVNCPLWIRNSWAGSPHSRNRRTGPSSLPCH